jgi:glutathione S-transferase
MYTCRIIGRSSSHFTRVVRVFAHELEIAHTFEPVFDLQTLDVDNYAGNPALKIPILVDESGPLFGAENVCRELTRHSAIDRSLVLLRGDVQDRLVANAEELTLHVMSSGVSLIMAKLDNPGTEPTKPRHSIEACLDYLDREIDAVLQRLPARRRVSFVEVALFCVVRATLGRHTLATPHRFL